MHVQSYCYSPYNLLYLNLLNLEVSIGKIYCTIALSFVGFSAAYSGNYFVY